MPSYLTSSTLINNVTIRAHVPTSQVTFSSDDFLSLANDEVSLGLVPSIMKLHEEYFVYTVTTPLVANQSAYPIPARAIGMKLRTLFLVDSNGNPRELGRISPEDAPFYQNNSHGSSVAVFYFEGNTVVLLPSLGAQVTGSLMFKYFQKPNRLVDASRVATIQSIDRTTGAIVVDAVPSVFTGTPVLDLLETSAGHRWRAIDVSPTSINSTLKTITFAIAAIPSDLVVGDMIALAGECMIPQIPDELHPVLAQRVVCTCLQSQGDVQGLATANAKLQEMETAIGVLIDNRSEGNPQKVNNLRGTLRATKARTRRSFR